MFFLYKGKDYPIHFHINHDICNNLSILLKCISNICKLGLRKFSIEPIYFIVYTNCHFVNKSVEIGVPQAILLDIIFEVVVRIIYDM